MADLRALHAAMKAAHRDPGRFAASQSAFLRAVTEVADNDVLAGAASTIRSLLQFWVARVPLSKDSMDAQVTDAAAVIDAIAAGDDAAARAAMGRAMDRANEEIRRALPSGEAVATS
jgi:DNA-binding GntR family transcriptional regulator